MTHYRPESKKLTDEIRNNCTDGAFIALPSCNTHYKIEGTGERWAVLVHGYATPYFIYDKIADGLVRSGYRVLRYDLPGRGLSERVKTEYTPSFFARNLHELISALLPEKPFDLIATSMGGIIVTTYIAEFHPPVKSLTLLAPAGMRYSESFGIRLARKKGIGEILFALAKRRQERACAAEMLKSGAAAQEEYREKYSYYAQFKGLQYATLSSLRYTLSAFDASEKNYANIDVLGIPVLIIWGTKDNTMPFYQSEQMMKLVPQAKLIVYENSGHIFLYDEGERTTKDVLQFLQETHSKYLSNAL